MGEKGNITSEELASAAGAAAVTMQAGDTSVTTVLHGVGDTIKDKIVDKAADAAIDTAVERASRRDPDDPEQPDRS